MMPWSLGTCSPNRNGCVSCNYFWFYRFAVDALPEAGEWHRIDTYAAALEDYTRPAPSTRSDNFISRARALAD